MKKNNISLTHEVTESIKLEDFIKFLNTSLKKGYNELTLKDNELFLTKTSKNEDR